MHQSYAGNADYMNDCLAFIDLLRAQVLSPYAMAKGGVGTNAIQGAAKEEALCAIYSDIREGGRAALLNKVDLRLEKLIRKHKLDDVEVQILWILVSAAVNGDDDLNRVANIRKMVSVLNKIDPIAASKYWRRDAKLIEKKIVLPVYPMRGQTGIAELSLRPDDLDRLLGLKVKREKAAPKLTSPATMFGKLGEYVVGQEQARRTLATGIFKHLQICKLNRKRKGVDRIPKANIMMLGSTGTGKTHLCRTLAKMLQLPMVICDATQYTETGYVGANVECMLVALYEKAGRDQRKMETGIIYIDEIDKIAQRNVGVSHNSNKDVSGLSVQQELLKLLDGDMIEYRDQYRTFNFDVTNILFIVGGAFAGMEEIIAGRMKRRGIGFAAGGESQEAESVSHLQQVTTEDILAYGFAPEFVGRFASIVALDHLGKEDLVDIMTKPKNSLLSQYQALFNASGLDLQIPNTALEWVAEQALRNNTGARGLKAILEANLSPILFKQDGVLGARSERPSLRRVVFEPVVVETPEPLQLPSERTA